MSSPLSYRCAGRYDCSVSVDSDMVGSEMRIVEVDDSVYYVRIIGYVDMWFMGGGNG